MAFGGGNMREKDCSDIELFSNYPPASPLENFLESVRVLPIAPGTGASIGFIIDAYRCGSHCPPPENPFLFAYILGGIGAGISAAFCGARLTSYIKDKIKRRELEQK